MDKKYVLHAPVLRYMIDDPAARDDVLEINGLRDLAYETCYFDHHHEKMLVIPDG